MSWIILGASGICLLLAGGLLYWNHRLSTNLGTLKEREKAIREAQRRLQKAQAVRRRARKRGSSLLDSLQDRPK